MTKKENRDGKGYSFMASDGHWYLVRCHKCGLENWSMAVTSGKCAWCGFDANKKGKEKNVQTEEKK